MKRLFVAFAVLSLMGCNSTRSTDRLLAEVWRKDQDIRHQMIELTRAVSVDKRVELIDSLITITEEIERIDNQNMAIVDSLLQSALAKGLSAESYKTIWIVIDHASLEKQVQHLPLIEQMALEGLIERDNYATLFDRIAMKQNRPQRYGSQAVQFGAIIVDSAKVSAETKAYKKIPIVNEFKDENGNDIMQEQIERNYSRIKDEVEQIVQDEMERIKADPVLRKRLLPEDNDNNDNE